MTFRELSRSTSAEKLWYAHMAAGRMACDVGSYLQAARQFKAALETARAEQLPAAAIARSLSGLARAHGGLGENTKAESLVREAISMDESDPKLAPECINADRLELVAILRETNRNAEAESIALAALDSLSTSTTTAAKELQVLLLRQLAIIYLETGQLKDCEARLTEAIGAALATPTLGKSSLAYGQLLCIQSLLLIDSGKFEEASDVYKEANQIMQIYRGPQHPRNEELSDVFERHLNHVGRSDLKAIFVEPWGGKPHKATCET